MCPRGRASQTPRKRDTPACTGVARTLGAPDREPAWPHETRGPATWPPFPESKVPKPTTRAPQGTMSKMPARPRMPAQAPRRRTWRRPMTAKPGLSRSARRFSSSSWRSAASSSRWRACSAFSFSCPQRPPTKARRRGALAVLVPWPSTCRLRDVVRGCDRQRPSGRPADSWRARPGTLVQRISGRTAVIPRQSAHAQQHTRWPGAARTGGNEWRRGTELLEGRPRAVAAPHCIPRGRHTNGVIASASAPERTRLQGRFAANAHTLLQPDHGPAAALPVPVADLRAHPCGANRDRVFGQKRVSHRALPRFPGIGPPSPYSAAGSPSPPESAGTAGE